MCHLKQKTHFSPSCWCLHHCGQDTIQNTLGYYSIIPPLTLFVTTELLRHQKSGNLVIYYGKCVFIWSGDGLWTFSTGWSGWSGWIGYWGLFPLLTVTRVINIEAPDSSGSHPLLWHQIYKHKCCYTKASSEDSSRRQRLLVVDVTDCSLN